MPPAYRVCRTPISTAARERTGEELQHVAYSFPVPLGHQLDRRAARKGTDRLRRTNHPGASPIAYNTASIAGR
jgi:hypothetical protein